jgi:hypothetical protein
MSRVYVPPTMTPAATPTPADPVPVPAQTDANAPAANAVETPARTPTPIEEFHPSLDPSKVSMTFDPVSGKLQVRPIEAAAADGPVQDSPAPTPPASPAAPAEPSTPAAPVSEVTELKGQVSQLTTLVTAMVQAQASGRPLAEVLGQPAAPAAPDYADVDMYDPKQAAQLVRDVVRAEIQNSMSAHQPTLDAARRRQEFDAALAKHGTDPAFHDKSLAAMELVKANPALTINAAYDLVASIAKTLQPKTAAAPAAPAQTATRTITPEQAAEKAAQAKNLPSNSGVRGEGRSGPPAHIKGLGQMIAWELQQASVGS